MGNIFWTQEVQLCIQSRELQRQSIQSILVLTTIYFGL